MNKKIYFSSILLFLLLCSRFAFSQTTAIDTLGDFKSIKKASLKAGLNYLNNSVYLGRADTVNTPLIEPNLKYTFANGIYFSGNVQIVPNRKTNKLDGGSLSAGYDFELGKNSSGSISYSQLFYNATSTQIGSSIGSTINANIDYDISDIITPSLSIDYNILKQGFGSDVMVNFGISHDFAQESIFAGDDIGLISPTATVNAGTQNFYSAFLTLKKYKLPKAGKAQKLLSAQDAKLAKFQLLDFEFAAPIEYKTGPVLFSFTPTYAFAENKLPASITKGMVSTQSGLFFFEIGASVKF